MIVRRRVLFALSVGIAAVGLALVLAEGGLRLFGRIVEGAVPRTAAEAAWEAAIPARRISQLHAVLNVAPRPGASTAVGDKSVHLSSLGYRSPERPVDRPPDTVRIVVAGGSTTFDSLSPTDEETWPWQLEDRLAADGPVEVWNAGFPTWTSAENLASLALRDAALEPDLVLLYQGFNDLQPASHRPFDPTYEEGHGALARRAMGHGIEAPGILGRSLVVDRLRGLSVSEEPLRHGDLALGAVGAFRRNVVSFVAVARAHGIEPVLATHPVRIRGGSLRERDIAYLEAWLPSLRGKAVPENLEVLNEVVREVGASLGVVLIDAARNVDWHDRHFADPVHYSRDGARVLAGHLAGKLRPIVDGLRRSGHSETDLP